MASQTGLGNSKLPVGIVDPSHNHGIDLQHRANCTRYVAVSIYILQITFLGGINTKQRWTLP